MEFADVFVCEKENKDFFSPFQISQSVIRPNFFIVGAPKCGTTAMNDYLNEHPDIFMARKELHYFGCDLKTRLKLSEEEYLKYFSDAGQKKVIGEASVWYLFSTTAAEEIKKFSPQAKILIMLRNPVDVVYSLHSQHLYDGNEDIQDFETALSFDEDRKRGIHLPDSVDYFELPPYKDSVLFSNQVKRYLDVFGRENVHVVLHEDLTANAENTFFKVLEFLGVSKRILINYGIVNPGKQIKSFFLHRVIKKPSLRLKTVARFLIPARAIRHFIMSFFFKWNIKQGKREDMSERLKTSLKNFFEEDIRLLSKLIDRDLSAWLK